MNCGRNTNIFARSEADCAIRSKINTGEMPLPLASDGRNAPYLVRLEVALLKVLEEIFAMD